jgi:hypothetical protein
LIGFFIIVAVSGYVALGVCVALVYIKHYVNMAIEFFFSEKPKS